MRRRFAAVKKRRWGEKIKRERKSLSNSSDDDDDGDDGDDDEGVR